MGVTAVAQLAHDARNPLLRWLTQPTAASNLALLRVGVGLAAMHLSIKGQPWRYANTPEALEQPSDWLGPVVAALPRGGWLQAASAVLAVASVTLTIGWQARKSAGVFTIVGLYVMGVPTIWGKVDHYHHVLWLTAVLAASPCADALVPWRSARKVAAARYGVPLRLGWLMLAGVYWAPGLAKATLGLEWGRHLPALVATESWFKHGVLTIPSWAGVPLGIATVVIEAGFVFALFTRVRPLWAVALFGMHAGIWLTTGIGFAILMVILPAVIAPFSAPADQDQAVPRSTFVVGGAVLAGVWVAALTMAMNAWPFAAYPLFNYLPDPYVAEWYVDDKLVADELGISRIRATRIPAERVSSLVGCRTVEAVTFDTRTGEILDRTPAPPC